MIERGLWCNIAIPKYIKPFTVEEWIRLPTKTYQNASIIWKVVVFAFPLIKDWLVWKVGDGTRMRLGEDP